MLKRTLTLALLALTVVVAPACSGPSADERKDPNVDAEWKRNNRAQTYRDAQTSQPTMAAQ